jgi:hypothetical protein
MVQDSAARAMSSRVGAVSFTVGGVLSAMVGSGV